MLQLQPLCPDALFLLGVLALEAGQAAEGIGYFHHAVTLQPQNASYQNALGEAYRAWGGLTEAAAAFQAALRLDPRLAAAHLALGLTLFDQGEVAAAVES